MLVLALPDQELSSSGDCATDGAMGDEGGNNGGAVSIGNYKGVMLCNRPFNGVATSALPFDID